MVTALGPTPLGYGPEANAPTPTPNGPGAYAPGLRPWGLRPDAYSGVLRPERRTSKQKRRAPTPTPEVTTAREPRSRAARLVLQRVSPRSAYQR